MIRLMLSDELWSKLRMIMRHHGVYDKPKLRITVEGILYRMRTGCPWRDLPSFFGKWNSVYSQFNNWSQQGKLLKIFQSLVKDPDLELELIDGSFVKAHQHSAGAAGEHHEAIGKSAGGNNTKIHMVVDAHGLPIKFKLSAGNVNDFTVAPELINDLQDTDFVVADKGYDSEDIRQLVRDNGASPVIPRRKSSKKDNNDIDWGIYKLRHLVENVFARLKHYRAIATRYDKLARNYESMVALASGYLWLPI